MSSSSATRANPADSDELHFLLAEQCREIMAGQSVESDFDIAFRLQLQEALTASLALHNSSPKPPPQEDDHQDETAHKDRLFALADFQREIVDSHLLQTETRRTKDDLERRVHDMKLAREISRIPEDDWQKWGGNYEKPYGEGCSKNQDKSDAVVRLYFKGLVNEVEVCDRKTAFAGIGVAICDSNDGVLLELRKPLTGAGFSKLAVGLKALIEGLNTAMALELKRLEVFCDNFALYQFITRRWRPKQRKIVMLVNQVAFLMGNFTSCDPRLVACSDLKFAFKLAREAIASQKSRPVDPSCGKDKETCVICLEDSDAGKMFSVDRCLHRYCVSCMKQHVEVKLLQGVVPKCPHDGCKSELTVDKCRTFLTPKQIETFNNRIREASIPVTEKVYCPYPKCSALMSKAEISEYAENAFVGATRSGARKCLKCHGLLCINCKVPWHSNMTCDEYRRMNPNPPAEDMKLKSLASINLWRQCVKCQHMIELSDGCYHMTCRCGYEFCYSCGAEWKNKRATCSCPLWHEDNIWFDDDRDFDDDETEDDFDDSDYYDSDSEYLFM